MIVSTKQLEFIENNLKLYGVTSKNLREDLIDHICTYIESSDTQDFNTLYQEALQKFGGYASFQNLQLETTMQKFAKELTHLNKLTFIIGCMSSVILALSLIFKMMHWPYANALLILAIALFAVVVLPVYFYSRYKKSIHQYS